MRGRAAPPHPGIYRVPPGNYHMSIKKSQAILKHFVDLKFSVWFTLCPENETMFCDRTFSRSTADQDCQNTKWLAVYPASRVALIALRSFLDKSGKGKKERGKRKAERGKRKEERGKRKEERGKRKRKLKKVLIVTNWRSSFSEPSVNQTLNLRSIERFRIAWLFLIDIW